MPAAASAHPVRQSAPRAALYARISEDPLQLEKGVTRQLDDAMALAAARGWAVIHEPFVDNDLSAFTGKRRPAYEALMTLVAAGQVDQIVVYSSSRLWRNRRERAEGMELLRRAAVGVAAVKGPDLDFTSAAGRMLAGMLGEFDTHESEVKAERVARAAKQRADEGRPNGTVPYGWVREYDRDERGRVVGSRDLENPTEAAIVREAVDRLLAGDSLRAITADLQARGVPSPKGRQTWGTSTVRKLVLRESNAARRVHQGEVVGRAQWPAIVDEDKHDRVRALLSAPERAHSRDGMRRHLLSFGIGECGVCRDRLRAVAAKRSRKVAKARSLDNPDGKVTAVHRLYVCNGRACVGRNQDHVDELVAAVVTSRLQRPDAVDLLRGNDIAARDHLEKAQAVRARLETAADDYADGAITADQMRRITARLRPQLDDLEREALAAVGPSVEALGELVGSDDVRARWDALPVTRRRAVLQALGLAVVIKPTRRGAGFDPTSVSFEWRSPVN